MRDHTRYEGFVGYIEFGSCLVTRVVEEGHPALDLYRYLTWLQQVTHVVDKFRQGTPVQVVYMKCGGVVFDLGVEDSTERWTYTVDNRLGPIDWAGSSVVQRRTWLRCINKRRKAVKQLVEWSEFYEYEIEHLPFLGP